MTACKKFFIIVLEMGTASSVQPKQGVHANPRVVYADQLSKQSKTKVSSYCQ